MVIIDLKYLVLHIWLKIPNQGTSSKNIIPRIWYNEIKR